MVSALISHLPVLAPDLHFRFLKSPAAPGQLSEAANVDEIVVHAAANGPGTMWWLPRIVDMRGVDVFHATFNILPAGLTMPSVTTMHDLMWLEHPDWCESGWRQLVRRPFFKDGIKRALQRSTFIAAVSEATRNSVIEASPATSGKTFVTPSGVSRKFHRIAPDPASISAMGLNPSRRFVLTVGQLAPYKNHVGALRSFAIASRGREDVDLVFVQRRGRSAQSLLDLAKDLGIESRVHVLSEVTESKLILLYSSATLLLHPSLCEGFGHPLAEAMACGCPVITGDRSAMPEVTANAALLANPEDIAAIAEMVCRVLDNAKLAAEMSRRGIERAQELRWSRFAEANLELYRKALSL